MHDALLVGLIEGSCDLRTEAQGLLDGQRSLRQTVGEGFSRRFVPASFLLSAATLVLTGDVRRAMTMLLVACPCAVGLSTPHRLCTNCNWVAVVRMLMTLNRPLTVFSGQPTTSAISP